MPDFVDFVQIDGKYYCWERDKDELVEVHFSSVKSTEIYRRYHRLVNKNRALKSVKENENGTD